MANINIYKFFKWLSKGIGGWLSRVLSHRAKIALADRVRLSHTYIYCWAVSLVKVNSLSLSFFLIHLISKHLLVDCCWRRRLPSLSKLLQDEDEYDELRACQANYFFLSQIGPLASISRSHMSEQLTLTYIYVYSNSICNGIRRVTWIGPRSDTLWLTYWLTDWLTSSLPITNSQHIGHKHAWSQSS